VVVQVGLVEADVAKPTQPSNHPEPLFFSVREAARLLGVCPNTVWNLLRDGELPRCGLRRRTLIARKDLLDLATRMNRSGVVE
jgi:excisionase family DNA binding protein